MLLAFGALLEEGDQVIPVRPALRLLRKFRKIRPGPSGQCAGVREDGSQIPAEAIREKDYT
jgi:hypothetical protein